MIKEVHGMDKRNPPPAIVQLLLYILDPEAYVMIVELVICSLDILACWCRQLVGATCRACH